MDLHFPGKTTKTKTTARVMNTDIVIFFILVCLFIVDHAEAIHCDTLYNYTCIRILICTHIHQFIHVHPFL